MQLRTFNKEKSFISLNFRIYKNKIIEHLLDHLKEGHP